MCAGALGVMGVTCSEHFWQEDDRPPCGKKNVEIRNVELILFVVSLGDCACQHVCVGGGEGS